MVLMLSLHMMIGHNSIDMSVIYSADDIRKIRKCMTETENKKIYRFRQFLADLASY